MALTGTIRTLMRIDEKSSFVGAWATVDTAALATAFTLALYRFDSSGSMAMASQLAYIDGAAASATPWVAQRPKAMLVTGQKVVLSPGDVVALVMATAWAGTVSMRFGRVTT